MAKSDSRKAERWRQHLDEHRDSGLTRKAYCRKHRLNIHQMDYWRKRLKRAPEVTNPINKNDFIHLQVKEDTLPDSYIKLQVGQVIVEVPDGFDPENLKNILRVLGAAC
jgi:hypothetical protein